MNRRQFIRATALTPFLAAQMKTRLAHQVNKAYLDTIGLQLYTARHQLGEGIIPINPIIEAAKEAGVQYCHVEQDLSHNPMRSIQRSLTYLRF